MSAILPKGGRYQWQLTDNLVETFAQMEGVKPDYVTAFPGSSGPLHYTVLAYTSPTRSYVTADPGYEAGMHAAKVSRARVVKTGLTKTYAHDVKAMLAAAPDAGVFYICTPNNPTGTLTPHSDIEYLVANKPKDSIVLVDEAYIHFSGATSAIDAEKGIPLGLGPGDFSEVDVVLSQDSRLVFYSDGITEAENSGDEQYGLERLKSHFLRPGACAESLLDDVRTFANSTGLQDDASVILVKG